MKVTGGLLSGGLLTTNSATGTTLSNANTVSGFAATNSGTGVISLTNGAALTTQGINYTKWYG